MRLGKYLKPFVPVFIVANLLISPPYLLKKPYFEPIDPKRDEIFREINKKFIKQMEEAIEYQKRIRKMQTQPSYKKPVKKEKIDNEY